MLTSFYALGNWTNLFSPYWCLKYNFIKNVILLLRSLICFCFQKVSLINIVHSACERHSLWTYFFARVCECFSSIWNHFGQISQDFLWHFTLCLSLHKQGQSNTVLFPAVTQLFGVCSMASAIFTQEAIDYLFPTIINASRFVWIHF